MKKRNSRFIIVNLFLCYLCVSGPVIAQSGRIDIDISREWQFKKGDSTSWIRVDVPHTWNIDDVMDDSPGYYRGPGWYKKTLTIDPALEGKELVLYFEGANQQTTVWINGKMAGEHIGGYTAFYVPATSLLRPGLPNEIMVRVDNSYNPNVPPLSADFTFYGGMYRKLRLIALDPVHFRVDPEGSLGIQLRTLDVNRQSGQIQVDAQIRNDGDASKRIKCISVVTDRMGKPVQSSVVSLHTDPHSTQKLQQRILVKRPRLWSPADPYLYTVRTSIYDASSGRLLDEQSEKIGFRWYHFDAAQGFFLNGRPCKLIGTSRHQDFKGLGNAVPAALAVEDVVLLKNMGGNFLRVAHYPQDQAVLNACDSLGILASVEIPIVNEITESDSFYNNCMKMQLEMIRQYYNHTSVIIWCYMNEVLLRPHFNENKERQKLYFAAITRLAKSLDSLTRAEDSTRYTMIAHHGDYKRYRDIGLVDIPMIVGWNLYSGWYGAKLTDFPVFLDAFHKDYPNKPMVVSEYGADADPRVRSLEPVRFDKSVEYTTDFHRYYIQEMLSRPFVAAAMIWNLADFNSETRTESMPHINNKGLLEWDRKPKDPYYYYQAVLLKTPFLKILGSSKSVALA